jgi:predicted site-specific integrase-resolvase
MNLVAWVQRDGVAWVTAHRWFHAGLLPVPARRVGRLILVEERAGEPGPRLFTAVYARVSSADQKAGLDRQVAGVTAWATAQQIADMTEMLTSMWGRLYRKGAAANCARRAVDAAADGAAA